MFRYNTPTLAHTPPAALPCNVLTTRGTLDSTPPYKGAPGGNISKGKKVITGVCFHECITSGTFDTYVAHTPTKHTHGYYFQR